MKRLSIDSVSTPARWLGPAVLVSIGLTACAPSHVQGGGSTALLVPLETLTQCPSNSALERVQLFDSEGAWARHVAQLAQEGAGALLLPKAWDWSNKTIVMVSLGRKSSSGYSVEFSGPATLEAKKLSVQYTPKEPAAGGFQAMALTHPCAYAQINSQAFDQLVAASTKQNEKALVIKRRSAN
jgi:PrcB C-terminal